MAQKKIDIKFNIDSKSVEIAGEKTMRLTTLARSLREELASGNYSQQEFDILSNKLDNVQERMEGTRLRAGDLFTSLQLIPGPIGEISSKVNGALATLRMFSELSFGDLKAQFNKVVDDVKQVGTNLNNTMGITSRYSAFVDLLTKKLQGYGVAQNAASTAAKGFAAALTVTGIGAIVVALGYLISNWDKVKDSIMGATAQSKAYEAAQTEVTKSLTDFNKKVLDVNAAFKQARAGTISKEEALKKYNDTLGSSVGYAGSLEQAEEAMAANTEIVVESIKLRAQAQVFYAQSAELAAKAVSGEETDPGFFDNLLNRITSLGDLNAFYIKQAQDRVKIQDDFIAQSKVLADEGIKLENQAIENDKKVKEFLAKPPDTSGTKQAVKSTKEEYEKAFQEVTLAQMKERDREEAIVTEKYERFIQLAKDNGKDTKIFEEALRKELDDIKTKYEKKDAQTAFDEQVKKLELRKQTGEIKEEEYQKALLDLAIKYDIKKEEAQEKYTAFLNAEEEKRLKKQREVLYAGLQGEIDAIDKANTLLENDFAEDNARLEQKKLLLQQQRDLELQAVKDDEAKRLEIIKKYADAETEIEKQVTLNKETELEARKTAQLEYAQAIGSAFGVLSGFLKEGTAAAKAAALAEIAIGTAVGFINALDIAQKTAKGTGPAAAFAFPIFYATQIGAVLAAASRAKAILKSGSGSSSDLETNVANKNAAEKSASQTAAPTGVVARRAQGGFVYGDGGATTDSIPAMLSNGEFVMNARSSAMFSPMLTAMNNMGNLPNTSVPQSLGNQSLVDVMAQTTNNRPIKTYVTAQDMSNQQQFDRTIKSRSLI